ncbi:hypothetical protein BCR33DRAFT_717551, partial [Rhizoclosmatium globosum]
NTSNTSNSRLKPTKASDLLKYIASKDPTPISSPNKKASTEDFPEPLNVLGSSGSLDIPAARFGSLTTRSPHQTRQRKESIDSTDPDSSLNSARSSITDGPKRIRMRASEINKTSIIDLSPYPSLQRPAAAPLSEMDEMRRLRAEIEKLHQENAALKQTLEQAAITIPVVTTISPSSRNGSTSSLTSLSQQAPVQLKKLASMRRKPTVTLAPVGDSGSSSSDANGMLLIPAGPALGSSNTSLDGQSLPINPSPLREVSFDAPAINSTSQKPQNTVLPEDVTPTKELASLTPTAAAPAVQRSVSLATRARVPASQILSNPSTPVEDKLGLRNQTSATQTNSSRRASTPTFSIAGTKQLKGILKPEPPLQSEEEFASAIADPIPPPAIQRRSTNFDDEDEDDEEWENQLKRRGSTKKISWFKTIISEVKLFKKQ